MFLQMGLNIGIKRERERGRERGGERDLLIVIWSISNSVVCLLAEIQSNQGFGIALIIAL